MTRSLLPTTAEEAETLGWSVDPNCYPWVAYKGPRFKADAWVYIETPPWHHQTPPWRHQPARVSS